MVYLVPRRAGQYCDRRRREIPVPPSGKTAERSQGYLKEERVTPYRRPSPGLALDRARFTGEIPPSVIESEAYHTRRRVCRLQDSKTPSDRSG